MHLDFLSLIFGRLYLCTNDTCTERESSIAKPRSYSVTHPSFYSTPPKHYTNKDHFISSIFFPVQALERPIRLTFTRVVQSKTPILDSVNRMMGLSNKTAATALAVSGVSDGGYYSATGPSFAKDAISKEEEAKRREARTAAASKREGAWDRKVKQSKGKAAASGAPNTKVFDHSEAASIGYASSETQRMIEATKREEERIASQLGYSPFEPAMSFSSGSGKGMSSSSGINYGSSGSADSSPRGGAPVLERGFR